MSEQFFEIASENQISLKDIIDFLAESWKTIMLGGVAGGLLALGYALKVPAEYRATANFQMAKVAGIDVEPIGVLHEKLKMPMFYSQKTYAACGVIENFSNGEAFVNKLKPTLAKNSSFITISYLGASPVVATKCLESVLDEIRVNQSLLAKPILQAKSNELVLLRKKLESSEKILQALPTQNTGFDFSDSKFSASALLLAATLGKENEIKDLRIQITNLEIALLEPQTRETFLLTPIYAPQQKASPSFPKITVVGLAAGFFIGLLLMLGKRFYGAYKASHSPKELANQ